MGVSAGASVMVSVGDSVALGFAGICVGAASSVAHLAMSVAIPGDTVLVRGTGEDSAACEEDCEIPVGANGGWQAVAASPIVVAETRMALAVAWNKRHPPAWYGAQRPRAMLPGGSGRLPFILAHLARLGTLRASRQARHPGYSPASRVSISELLGAAAVRA